MPPIDKAGRQIAGLLGYNPGPGIYSRLERAIEAMPANVRVQELPGLLKRYKEGVPGWELNEVDLPGLIGDAQVIPRQDLLDRVRERSPVYTHREVVLGESGPHMRWEGDNSFNEPGAVPRDDMPAPSAFSATASPHGQPVYPEYGQGGQNYTEVLLLQPGARHMGDYGNHWGNARATGTPDAVAHARYDIHGDALRINELQSDLGIHNRKQREIQPVPSGRDAELIAMKDRRESDAMYIERMRELGHEVARGDDGGWVVVGSQAGRPLPFPMEDAWAELLIKRLALEAARKGHRAIEVASPRAIADKVGGNIDNYEHFYGKVVPGAIERLGRKMGGLVEDAASSGRYVRPEEPLMGYGEIADRLDDFQGPSVEAWRLLRSLQPPGPQPAFGHAPQAAFNRLVRATGLGPNAVVTEGTMLQGVLEANFLRAGMSGAEATLAASQHIPRLVRLAEEQAAMYASHSRLRDLGEAQERARGLAARRATKPPGRRYIMSDEMRRRLIEQGVGASVLAPLMMQEE